MRNENASACSTEFGTNAAGATNDTRITSVVAMASFTPVDDDDSPLRPTGYAERLRRPARGPVDHYDSEWIHGRRTRYGRGTGDDPGNGPPAD